MARVKNSLDVDEIQLWMSRGISVFPKVKCAFSLMLALLVATDKLCWIPVSKMEHFSDDVRRKHGDHTPTLRHLSHK